MCVHLSDQHERFDWEIMQRFRCLLNYCQVQCLGKCAFNYIYAAIGDMIAPMMIVNLMRVICMSSGGSVNKLLGIFALKEIPHSNMVEFVESTTPSANGMRALCKCYARMYTRRP